MNLKSKKDKILFISISSIIVLSILVIFMPMIFLNIYKTNFIITSNEPISDNVITISNLNIEPGTSKTSFIKFKCQVAGNYNIKLDLEEKGIGYLKKYLTITIKKDGKIYYQDSLEDALKNNDIYVTKEFAKDEEVQLDIIYTMPLDVGNEAQGSSVDFDIKILIN